MGPKQGMSTFFAGLAPQRQAAQNWVLIGFLFSLLQPKLHKGIPLLSRAFAMTQIYRFPLSRAVGQAGKAALLAGRVLAARVLQGWVSPDWGCCASRAGCSPSSCLYFQDGED